MIEPGLGGPLLELDIAEPALDRELVPHDFLLIGEVLFLLPGPGYGEKRSALRACTRYHSYWDPYPGSRCHCSPLEPSHPNTRPLGQTFTSQNLMTYNVTQTIRLLGHQVPGHSGSRPGMRLSPRHHSLGLPNQAIHFLAQVTRLYRHQVSGPTLGLYPSHQVLPPQSMTLPRQQTFGISGFHQPV